MVKALKRFGHPKVMTWVYWDERFVDSEQAEMIHESKYVMVSSSVEMDNVGDAQIVVE